MKRFLPFLLLLLLIPADSAAYHVHDAYYCYATGSDGNPLQDAEVMESEAYVFGEHTKLGGSGNYGTLRYCADIATATVSAYAFSHGVQTGPHSYSSATARVNQIGFKEELIFSVPAGEYPDGVEVAMDCRAYGVFSADIGAGAKGECYVDFGSEDYDSEYCEVPVDEAGEIWIDDFTTLVHELVAPGSILNQAADFEVVLRAYFHVGRTWATESQNEIGDGRIDFERGVRITALRVPAGVSWGSASGVFPDLTSSSADTPPVAALPHLLPNHPNPFNPATWIRFELPRATAVSLAIYDSAGRRVRMLLDGELREAGLGGVTWTGEDERGRALAAGVYLCRLEAEGRVSTVKLSLLK